MPRKPLNRSLHAAKTTKHDEFYTQLSDIEKELRHYTKHFKGKTVLCNCDDPRVSNFFHYFSYNFEKLKLKKLITTCYKNQKADLFSANEDEKGVYLEYAGDNNRNRIPDPSEIEVHELKGDGDFRSTECVALLKQADIVVTNPPFSLFREYVAQLIEYKKRFVIIGSKNAITYKDIFSLIKDNKLWLGIGFDRGNAYFKTPAGKEYASGVYDPETGLVKFRNVGWFTNLEHQKRKEEMILFNKYVETDYPTYDNYDAIEVSKTKDIPVDYDGAMGVPITFLDRYNPNQFQILGITDRGNEWGLKTKEYTKQDVANAGDLNRRAAIRTDDKYKSTYARLLIRKKK
jgi:hypothetical protein